MSATQLSVDGIAAEITEFLPPTKIYVGLAEVAKVVAKSTRRIGGLTDGCSNCSHNDIIVVFCQAVVVLHHPVLEYP
jgi:hypothetical protein